MSLRIRLFCHSLVSDWNHGNAHFLRGIAAEFQARGHDVLALEPEGSWSLANLLADAGQEAVDSFHQRFPALRSQTYSADPANLDELLNGVDIAIVHEWNSPELIQNIGHYRRNHSHIRIFFHDTHHRAVTAPAEMNRNDLTDYDGILVYGTALLKPYERMGWRSELHVWHEAADVRVFHPMPHVPKTGDLVWIGNWGDDERTAELERFLIGPAEQLRLKTQIFGVRFPQTAIARLRQAGIEYGGWVANYRVPEVFAQHRVTVHVPRGPYLRQLPGIPTIRPFEAMACGIPLISAQWHDSEGLFREGTDFLCAETENETKKLLSNILSDAEMAHSLSQHGRETILARHTCGHRVHQLFEIYERVRPARHGLEVQVTSV